MKRTRIKICGITSIEDALLAAELGTDAIGLIFYEKSLRYIDVNQAQKIIASLPPFITVVGVFVDPEINFIKNILQKIPLDTLQFHGKETSEFCQQFNRPYIKAIAMTENIDLLAEAKSYASAQALLLDSTQGGSGKKFDWNLIPKNLTKPIILAGGLNADNVAAAIAAVKPYAVDVTSGVEKEPRIKDLEKMKSFFDRIK